MLIVNQRKNGVRKTSKRIAAIILSAAIFANSPVMPVNAVYMNQDATVETTAINETEEECSETKETEIEETETEETETEESEIVNQEITETDSLETIETESEIEELTYEESTYEEDYLVTGLTANGISEDDESIIIDENIFPDDIFRMYVKKNVDIDSDGKLSKSEINNVYQIECGNESNGNSGALKSLKGIEVFTELEYLDCSDNEIERLELRRLRKLKTIKCEHNKIEELILINLPKLEYLDCSNNKLAQIDISELISLELLYCCNNNLTSLEVNDLVNLEYLVCSSNKLSNLEISNLKNLETLLCGNNDLYALNLNSLTRITDIDFAGNNLEYIDFTGNRNDFGWTEIPVNPYVICSSGTPIEKFCKNCKIKYTTGKVSYANVCLTNIDGSYTQTRKYPKNRTMSVPNIKSIGGKYVEDWYTDANYSEKFEFESTPIKNDITLYAKTSEYNAIELNEKNFPDKVFREYLAINFDIDNNDKLSLDEILAVKNIYSDDKGIKSLAGIDIFLNLENLSCGKNEIEELDVTSLKSLKYLSCEDNKIKNINVSGLSNLIELDCMNNCLKELSLEGLNNLEVLNCYKNELIKLDVRDNTKLIQLDCDNNKIEDLKVTELMFMTMLSCEYNMIKQLDLSGLKNLDYVDCTNNKIDKLIFKENPNLTCIYCTDNCLKDIDLRGLNKLECLYCQNNNIGCINLFGNKNEVQLIADSDVTIICSAKSYLEEYCKQNDIKYVVQNLNVNEPELPLIIEPIENQYYTGFAVQPKLDIYFTYDEKSYENKLVEGVDYTVAYSNCIKPGIANAVVTFKGNYTGKFTRIYNILPRDLESDDIKVEKLGIAYNGKNQKKAPTVNLITKSGNYVLKEGRDYEVWYEPRDFVEPGTYNVRYKGIGNFTGETEGKVYIADKQNVLNNAKVTILDKNITYDGAEKCPNISVKLGNEYLSEGSEYSVQYINNINVGKATIIITGENYVVGSKKIDFMIKNGNISGCTIKVEDSEFLKGGAVPDVYVNAYGKDLERNIDYTVRYLNNKKVGTATVIVTGKGKFYGSAKKTFNITPKSIGSVNVNKRAADVIYSNKNRNYISKLTLTDLDGKNLTSADYRIISYSCNGEKLGSKSRVEEGSEITVLFEGKGNYKNTGTVKYKVRKATDISRATIKITNHKYIGTPIVVGSETMTVTIGNGKNKISLVEGQDFEIVDSSFKNNINKGTAEFYIHGIGAYAGEKKVTFKIVAKY